MEPPQNGEASPHEDGKEAQDGPLGKHPMEAEDPLSKRVRIQHGGL